MATRTSCATYACSARFTLSSAGALWPRSLRTCAATALLVPLSRGLLSTRSCVALLTSPSATSRPRSVLRSSSACRRRAGAREPARQSSRLPTRASSQLPSWAMTIRRRRNVTTTKVATLSASSSLVLSLTSSGGGPPLRVASCRVVVNERRLFAICTSGPPRSSCCIHVCATRRSDPCSG